jgi:hypothetical protein
MRIRTGLITFAMVSVLGAAAWTQSPATVSPTNMAEDIAQFRREFMAVDKSYSAANRGAAEKRLAALEAALATTTPVEFEIAIARIVALADNGHTNAAALPRARRHNRVPVRMAPFIGDFYVLRVRGADADLLGARLVSIDGQPAAKLREIAHTLTGGTAGFRDRFTPLLLESPQLLHAAGATRAPAEATYVFEVDGKRIERRLAGEAPNAAVPSHSSLLALYPDPAVPEGAGWRSLLEPKAAPWALQDAAARFRWREAPELNAMIVEFRQNRSTPGYDIGDFQELVQRELRARKPRNLVLDMRMNGGGDLTTTRSFMQGLPTLVPGGIFVLTSPWTFSAAISSTGYLEQAAPDRVTIVGEEVGDRLESWSEGSPFTLARSGIVISRATERHDYATGCKPYKDCHGNVVRHPISVRTLEPNVAAPWTIEEYRAGRDPAMEAVARSLKK